MRQVSDSRRLVAPPNPKAEAARADIMAYNATVLAAPPPLYPLSAAAPLHFAACHSDGVELYVDDPASIDAPQGAENEMKERNVN